MKEANALKKLLPLLKLYPWAIPLIVILGIFASLSEGLGISLFVPLLQSFEASSQAQNHNFLIDFLDRILTSFPETNRVLVAAVFIFCSILLKNGLLYLNTLFFSWLNWRISHRLRSGIFKQLLSVSYEFLEQHPSSKFLHTLDGETWRTSQALSLLVSLIISSCTIGVFTILLLLISWQLTLVVALVMLLISVAIRTLTRQVKRLGKQAEQANHYFVHRAWEGLSGMQVIRAFGRESYEQARFDQASQQVCIAFMRLDRISGVVQPLSEVMSAALLACTLVLALQSQANLPTLLTFVFMLYRLQPQVRQLDGARVNLISMSAAVDDVMSLLDRSDKSYIRSGKQPFNGLENAIAFDDVSFRYGPAENLALHHLSLTIPQGKTTALVGPSGAGKSTLISLLCRFYEVNSGEIYVDGYPLRQFQLASWRDRIAIVSQNIHVFSTTIRENIAYGRLGATDAEVIAAARQAHAHEFICQMPQGYDTPVGDRGIRLSGGQRQRIALARAIIRQPEILILDEATNALDSISEQIIQDAIERISQNCTVIVIAHRLSTIEKADQIVVLEQGRIVEQGSLQHLLNCNQLFAQLYHLQYRPTAS